MPQNPLLPIKNGQLYLKTDQKYITFGHLNVNPCFQHIFDKIGWINQNILTFIDHLFKNSLIILKNGQILIGNNPIILKMDRFLLKSDLNPNQALIRIPIVHRIRIVI